MEAPEKIFVPRNASGVLLNSWYLESDRDLENVEYICKDVFIEKATSYIQQHWIWNTIMIEDFKKYLEEQQ